MSALLSVSRYSIMCEDLTLTRAQPTAIEPITTQRNLITMARYMLLVILSCEASAGQRMIRATAYAFGMYYLGAAVAARECL